MSGADPTCRQCGTRARLLSLEGEVFPVSVTERPMLFQVIDCPHCGRREQPDGHDGKGGAIGNSVGDSLESNLTPSLVDPQAARLHANSPQHSTHHMLPELGKAHCEKCGSKSLLIMVEGDGHPRPRLTIKSNRLYVDIDCPKCGPRQRLVTNVQHGPQPNSRRRIKT
jgi:DNA-directed RNA polymerase subunit RPC12/RpoP